jgi:hypothetical protein
LSCAHKDIIKNGKITRIRRGPNLTLKSQNKKEGKKIKSNIKGISK